MHQPKHDSVSAVRSRHQSRSTQDSDHGSESPIVSSPALGTHPLLQLQRQYGNQHVQQMVQRRSSSSPIIQAKLTLGQVGDRYEQEADRVAKEVVNRISSAPSDTTQRMGPEDEEMMAQTQPAFHAKGTPESITVSSDIEAAIQQKRGRGQAMDSQVQEQMESAFGVNFDGVRVHTDSEADVLNNSLNAHAFTTGQDIFFRQGEYDSSSPKGKELIAHELTHVVQQEGAQLSRKSVTSESGHSDDHPKENGITDYPTVFNHTPNQQIMRTGDGDSEEPSRGSEENPYTALSVVEKSFTLDLYDVDLVYDDHLARMRLFVTWHEIMWRGKRIWIPHEMRTENSHFRGITLGGETRVAFSSGSSSAADLHVRLTWVNAIGTADIERTESTNYSGSLTTSQKNSIGLSATVPVEGVPVEGSVGSERSTGGGLSISHTYGQKYTDPGAQVQFSASWESHSTDGLRFNGVNDPPLNLLEGDETLKEHYGGGTEGDLDLELRERGNLLPPRESE
ncbi:MAG: DUF4157 domain-containing protein [Cyanobacteria bacterium P01_F01_bin.150]